jgi:hypothetical protein
MRVNFQRLKNSDVWHEAAGDAMLCHSGVRRHVALPRGCRSMDLVFTRAGNNPNCFAITRDGRVRVHRNILFYSFRELLVEAYLRGKRYVRVEVDDE